MQQNAVIETTTVESSSTLERVVGKGSSGDGGGVQVSNEALRAEIQRLVRATNALQLQLVTETERAEAEKLALSTELVQKDEAFRALQFRFSQVSRKARDQEEQLSGLQQRLEQALERRQLYRKQSIEVPFKARVREQPQREPAARGGGGGAHALDMSLLHAAQARVASLEEMVRRLESEQSKAGHERARLAHQVQAREREVHRLGNLLSEERNWDRVAAEFELEQRRLRIEQLEQQMDMLHEQNINAEQSVSENADAVQQMQRKMGELKAQNDELRAQAISKASETRGLQKELAALKRKYRRAQEGLDMARGSARRSRVKVQTEEEPDSPTPDAAKSPKHKGHGPPRSPGPAAAAAAAAKAKYAGAVEQLEEQKAFIVSLHRQLEESRKEAKQLRHKVFELKRTQEQDDEQDNDDEEASYELMLRLKEQLAAASQEIGSLQAELRSRDAELEYVKSEHEKAQAELEQTDSRAEELQEQLSMSDTHDAAALMQRYRREASESHERATRAQEELIRAEQRIGELRRELQAVQHQAKEVEEERARLQALGDRFHGDMADVQGSMRQLMDENSTLQRRVTALNNELDLKHHEEAHLRRTLEKRDSVVAALQVRNAELSREAGRGGDESVEQAAEARERDSALARQNRDLRTRLEDALDMQQSLQQTIADMHARAQRERSEMQRVQGEMDNLRGTLSEREAEIERLGEEVSRLKALCRQVRASRDATEAQLQEQVQHGKSLAAGSESWSARVEELEGVLATRDAELSACRRALEQLDGERDAVVAQLDRQTELCERMRAELEAARDNAAASNGSVSSLRQQLQLATEQLNAKDQEVVALLRHLDEAAERQRGVEEKLALQQDAQGASLEDLGSVVAQNQLLNSQLAEMTADRNRRVQDLEVTLARLLYVEEQVKSAEMEREDLKASYRTVCRENAALRAATGQLDSEREDSRIMVSAQQEAIAELEHKLAAGEQERARYAAELRSLDIANEEMARMLASVKQQLSASRAQHAALAEQVDSARSVVGGLQGSRDEAQRQAAGLVHEYERAEAQWRQAAEENQQLKQAYGLQQERVARLEELLSETRRLLVERGVERGVEREEREEQEQQQQQQQQQGVSRGGSSQRLQDLLQRYGNDEDE